MNKKVLVINCGSSSLKYSLYEMSKEKLICAGIFESLDSEFLDNSGKIIKHQNGKVVRYLVKVSKDDFDKEYIFESKLDNISFEIE